MAQSNVSVSECPRQFGAAPDDFQFASDIEMIVDFAVERHRETAAVAVHRLAARLRQIKHRKPAMAESDTGGSVGPVTDSVRSAIGQRIGHMSGDGGKLALFASSRPEQACDAAHQPALLATPGEGDASSSLNCRQRCSTAGETGLRRLDCICRLSPKARVATSSAPFAA